MKIKAVCEATGLTDRTIRYYIDEELISPECTENYLGRKSFMFSDADITALNDIAVLRKFGFSVPEIREMILHPESIPRITGDLQARKQSLVREEQALLDILSELNTEQTNSVSELAAYLAKPVSDAPIPAEDAAANAFRYVCELFSYAIKAVLTFPIIWGPVVLSIWILLSGINDYHYCSVLPGFVAATLASFLPTVLIYVLPKTQLSAKWKRIGKRVLLILCCLNLVISPVLAGGIITHSETTDIKNYRRLDTDCFANRDDLYQDLFPIWPHYFEVVEQPDGSLADVYLDAHYYYRFIQSFDSTYDIYAEWPLPEADFHAEIERVKSVFEEHVGTDYIMLQKGSYTCLITYMGDPPFQEVTNSYSYYIFAYDAQNLRVRYIHCYSLENGYDQPYYLTLNWE